MSDIPLPVLIIFGALFGLFIFAILFAIINGIKTWLWDNKQPVQTLPAKVVSKRLDDSNQDTTLDDDGVRGNVGPTYYATFELNSGERHRFFVAGSEYDMLAEGDAGTLTFQGTRYKGFVRPVAS